MNQRPGETLTHVPQMALSDFFSIHADLDDVKLAEESVYEESFHAGIVELDPLTVRIKARYLVAERMLRVRGESPIGQGISTLLPDHEASQNKEPS